MNQVCLRKVDVVPCKTASCLRSCKKTKLLLQSARAQLRTFTLQLQNFTLKSLLQRLPVMTGHVTEPTLINPTGWNIIVKIRLEGGMLGRGCDVSFPWFNLRICRRLPILTKSGSCCRSVAYLFIRLYSFWKIFFGFVYAFIFVT